MASSLAVLSTKIKICGITREQDAQAAMDAGVDAVGLMFVESSARTVSLEKARDLAEQMTGCLQRVGVFANSAPQRIESVLKQVELDALQFHGDEDCSACGRWGLPYLKTVRMGGPRTWDAVEAEHPQACALLLDTFKPGVLGGTGERFDLALWPRGATLKLVLSGGLNPDNVVAAMAATRPYGVDVSGGVEGSARGIKSKALINDFVRAVRQAE